MDQDKIDILVKRKVDHIATGLAAHMVLTNEVYHKEWDLVTLGGGKSDGSCIKCDVEHCNYEDETVSPQDFHKWLNKPCPVCGANLLTEKDLAAFASMCIRMIKVNLFANKWAPRLPKWIRNKIYNGDKTEVLMKQNGSGRIKMEKVEPEDG